MNYRLMIFMLIILNLNINAQNWEPLGIWLKGGMSGQSRVIKFVDDLMIFDAGRSIRLYNIENIDSPYELSSDYIPPAEDIHIFNSYIVIKLIYLNTLKIFRIDEGNKLKYVKDIEFNKNIIDVNIINDRLFLLNPNEISIYSIGNDFNIALDTVIISSNDQYSKIVGSNDYFITSKQSEIFVYRQNSNNSYSLVSSLNTGGGSIVDMKIKENNLLLSGYHIGLRIVDINQLSEPVVISNYYLEKTGLISFSKNAAFIHDYTYEGIKIFDISNPNLPVLKSDYFVGHQYTGENYYYRERLFLCNYYVSRIYQLKIVDQFQANYFQDIIAENHQYKFNQIQIYNNTAILRTNFGISFVNATNFDELDIYSEINDIGSVSNIQLYSDWLFVSAENKILIYDIEDPFDVKLLSTITYDEKISSFIVENGYIYLYSKRFFTIFHFSDLNNIQQIFQHSPSYSAENVSFSRMIKLGDQIHLYVHWQIEWSDPEDPYFVDVIDVSEPNNAIYIGHINHCNYNYKLYEHNGIIYGSEIAGYGEELSNKLHVCAIADLDSVYSIYETELSYVFDNLFFQGNYNYAYSGTRIMTIDLTIPTNPKQINLEILNFGITAGIYLNENTFYFLGYKDWRYSVAIYHNNMTSVQKYLYAENPNKFRLSQNYPNPFNPSTKIKYTIPVGDANFASSTMVQLKVYDVLGKEVATLVNKEQPAGNYEVEFNPSADGNNLSSGIYFYRLRAGSFVETKKMVLLR